jgi:hypothetical protein
VNVHLLERDVSSDGRDLTRGVSDLAKPSYKLSLFFHHHPPSISFAIASTSTYVLSFCAG